MLVSLGTLTGVLEILGTLPPPRRPYHCGAAAGVPAATHNPVEKGNRNCKRKKRDGRGPLHGARQRLEEADVVAEEAGERARWLQAR